MPDFKIKLKSEGVTAPKGPNPLTLPFSLPTTTQTTASRGVRSATIPSQSVSTANSSGSKIGLLSVPKMDEIGPQKSCYQMKTRKKRKIQHQLEEVLSVASAPRRKRRRLGVAKVMRSLSTNNGTFDKRRQKKSLNYDSSAFDAWKSRAKQWPTSKEAAATGLILRDRISLANSCIDFGLRIPVILDRNQIAAELPHSALQKAVLSLATATVTDSEKRKQQQKNSSIKMTKELKFSKSATAVDWEFDFESERRRRAEAHKISRRSRQSEEELIGCLHSLRCTERKLVDLMRGGRRTQKWAFVATDECEKVGTLQSAAQRQGPFRVPLGLFNSTETHRRQQWLKSTRADVFDRMALTANVGRTLLLKLDARIPGPNRDANPLLNADSKKRKVPSEELLPIEDAIVESVNQHLVDSGICGIRGIESEEPSLEVNGPCTYHVRNMLKTLRTDLLTFYTLKAALKEHKSQK